MSAWWKASLNWFCFYNSSFNIPFVPEHRNLWICSQLWGLGCWRAYCWRFMETTSCGWLGSIFVSFLCADLSARVILCCLLISWNTIFFYRFGKPIIFFSTRVWWKLSFMEMWFIKRYELVLCIWQPASMGHFHFFPRLTFLSFLCGWWLDLFIKNDQQSKAN